MSSLEDMESLSREELLALLAELKRSTKRQAAPFSKGTRVSNPKRPGRKPGEGTFSFRQAPRPEEITEPPVNVPVTLECCPRCGEKLAEERVDLAYLTELPPMPRPRVTQYRVWGYRPPVWAAGYGHRPCPAPPGGDSSAQDTLGPELIDWDGANSGGHYPGRPAPSQGPCGPEVPGIAGWGSGLSGGLHRRYWLEGGWGAGPPDGLRHGPSHDLPGAAQAPPPGGPRGSPQELPRGDGDGPRPQLRRQILPPSEAAQVSGSSTADPGRGGGPKERASPRVGRGGPGTAAAGDGAVGEVPLRPP